MAMPIFVYGTLMTDESQGGLLAGCSRTVATIRGDLFHLPAGYPALRLGSDSLVYGQLVELSDERVLGVLDQYEGVHEGLFCRCVADVTVGLRRVKGWVYVMEKPEKRGGKRLESGRWRNMRSR
jgi:gamma-glutamylcyclotransferase (GGCT)/AIG2-like uncharacterized protein YtfP